MHCLKVNRSSLKRNNQRLGAKRDLKDHIQTSHFTRKQGLSKVKEFFQSHSVINDILRNMLLIKICQLFTDVYWCNLIRYITLEIFDI